MLAAALGLVPPLPATAQLRPAVEVRGLSWPGPASWSRIVGAEAVADLRLGGRAALSVRFGGGRLSGAEHDDLGVGLLGVGLRYRFR